MTEAIPLHELFRIKARFCRSVNLSRDFTDEEALQGYIVTPLIRSILQRICEGIATESRVRAWSLTGPYGTGKSACCLFIAKVLGNPKTNGVYPARQILRSIDPELYDTLFSQIPDLRENGLCVIPITGSREPLALALLRGLETILLQGKERTPLVTELRQICGTIEQGETVLTEQVISLVERVTHFLCSGQNPYTGLLIILDELGKLLEYAALHPYQGDVYLLQSLAEAASRSKNNRILVITVLHQAFDRYAARLGSIHQQEWAKVHGRFEDIGFLESTDQLLKFIGSAIERSSSPAFTRSERLEGLSQVILSEAQSAVNLSLGPREMDNHDVVNVLSSCAPLHPTVALVLGNLFRSRLAQNERSLFAFLTSGEPNGFREYLHSQSWIGNGQRPFYRLDQLYDYVVGALGSTLYTQPHGKRWAEVEDALERLPRECSSLDSRVIKVIGLLNLLGDQYLKASEQVLSYALVDCEQIKAQDIQRTLRRLETWGIVVYRRYKDAYGLWEGSDIDLDAQFQKGFDQVNRSASLATLIEKHIQLQPYIAKRHLHETGTLRYFIPWIIDETDIDKVISRTLGNADGAIVFILPHNGRLPEHMVEQIKEKTERLAPPLHELLFFAIPRETDCLRQAVEEVMAWEWIKNNTPQLDGDRIARRELSGRLSDAMDRLERICNQCFDKAFAYSSCLWIWKGKIYTWESALDLSSALSEACAETYKCSPIIHNELVNRHVLSTAAAAARRTLIERMLAYPTKYRLGIEGYPPELSMYISVFEMTGLHHEDGNAWAFGYNGKADKYRIGPLWAGINKFLDTTETSKLSVSDFFAMLAQPPYGVKEGLHPLFLVAAIIRWQSEIALFENGSFIPEPNISVFERLIKNPEQFSIQRYRIEGVRVDVFKQYAAILDVCTQGNSQATLLDVIRPLFRFIGQLPPYCRLTRTVSKEVINVREVMLHAREPHRVLFEDLPQALGFNIFSPNTDKALVEAFFKRLKKALVELQQAYDLLLNTIEHRLQDTLHLPRDSKKTREIINTRAGALHDLVADLRLKAFVIRLADTQLPDRQWIESVAAIVANKPPAQWNDQDLLQYEITLTELANRFTRLEELAIELGQLCVIDGETRLMRLGITDQTGREQRQIVRISSINEKKIIALVDSMETFLRENADAEEIRIAAVAELTHRLLANSKDQDK